MTAESDDRCVAFGAAEAPICDMDTQENRRLLLAVPDAAAVLAVGRTTLYELIATRQLATVHIGRAVRVPRAELEAFVARRCQTTSLR